jgi:hypothetical protein
MHANNISIANLFSASDIYVIPNFQRPYAWENDQWEELFEDIRNATKKISPYHYFAPVHIVKIQDPNDGFWKNYTDRTNNTDIKHLEESNFRDSQSRALNVFLVIDGQQRLTTLYSLLHHYFPNFVTLANNQKIPNVILNSQPDQIAFRNLLGLHTPLLPVSHISRAQKRLKNLFNKINDLKKLDPCFDKGKPCHLFMTSSACETLCVNLTSSTRLAAFTTLNDRGKSLTNLEKAKSFFMEIDDNSSKPNPVSLNKSFGFLYQSLEAQDSYISDDESLRQIAMILWEGKSLVSISGILWPYASGSRSNHIHQAGANLLYEDYFKKIPSSIADQFLHSEIIPAIGTITDSHNDLVKILGLATTGTHLAKPSFTSSMGFCARDAIDDYQAVLLSLGLQTKQIGFLFAIRQLFPTMQWHDVLGSRKADNRRIKMQLHQCLSEIQSENQDVTNFDTNNVYNEINSIPDFQTRNYSAMQIAEALRLIVENSKPGGFSAVWNMTFCGSPSPQNFVDRWMDYVESYGSREVFIWKIARSSDAYNNNAWVKYLLKEYEYCIGGQNAHRNSNYEIEHFFPSSWKGPKYLTTVTHYGFANCEQYSQSFVDRIGNKLVIDSGLNRALKDQDPFIRSAAYKTQSYGAINVMSTNPSQSAINIGSGLVSYSLPNEYRMYVLLRSIQLAAFAARRF